MTQFLEGWWQSVEGKLILPANLGNQIITKMHQSIYMGTWRMQDLIPHTELKIQDLSSKTDTKPASSLMQLRTA